MTQASFGAGSLRTRIFTQYRIFPIWFQFCSVGVPLFQLLLFSFQERTNNNLLLSQSKFILPLLPISQPSSNLVLLGSRKRFGASPWIAARSAISGMPRHYPG